MKQTRAYRFWCGHCERIEFSGVSIEVWLEQSGPAYNLRIHSRCQADKAPQGRICWLTSANTIGDVLDLQIKLARLLKDAKMQGNLGFMLLLMKNHFEDYEWSDYNGYLIRGEYNRLEQEAFRKCLIMGDVKWNHKGDNEC